MTGVATQQFSFVLLAIAAALSYAGVQTLVRGIVRGPMSLAWVASLPVCATAGVAAWRGRWELAVAVLFSASVLSLVLLPGVTLVASPEKTTAISRKMRLLLPSALAVVLCGFKGIFTIYHAVILLGLYGVAIGIWRKQSESPAPKIAGIRRAQRNAGLTIAYTLIGSALAALGGWYGNEAVRVFERAAGLTIEGPAAALMLAPAALLAMIGLSSDAGRTGKIEDATDAAAGVALVNLGLLLPGLTIAWLFVRLADAKSNGGSFVVGMLSGDIGLPFAVGKWRLDAMLLTLASIFFLPAALGRFKMGRVEGLTLMLAYLLYVAVAASSFLAG